MNLDESNQALSYIQNLDLSHVVDRLVKQGKWYNKHAIEAVKAYKRYLFLQKKYGEQYELVPSYEIDMVWHEHILFSQQYHKDCLQIFGKYLHHDPEVNTSEPIGIDFRYEKTQSLYFAEYGEYMNAIIPTTWIGKFVIRLIKRM